MNNEYRIARLVPDNESIVHYTENVLPVKSNVAIDILVRVPDVIYQAHCDMARMNNNKENVKQAILRDLKEWVNNRYTGYGIAAFADYSIDEAKLAATKTGYPLTWGMWLFLQPGANMAPVDMNQKLLNKPLGRLE